jgi:hypothetical protein
VKNGTFESRQAIVKINRLEKLLIEKGIVSGVELQDAELTCREEEIKEHQRIETDFWNKIQPGMEVQQDGSFDRKRFTGTVISKTEKPFQALVIQITQKTRFWDITHCSDRKFDALVEYIKATRSARTQ